MQMPELRNFQIRPLGAGDYGTRALDHLSEGERAALVEGRVQALQSRRSLRWN